MIESRATPSDRVPFRPHTSGLGSFYFTNVAGGSTGFLYPIPEKASLSTPFDGSYGTPCMSAFCGNKPRSVAFWAKTKFGNEPSDPNDKNDPSGPSDPIDQFRRLAAAEGEYNVFQLGASPAS